MIYFDHNATTPVLGEIKEIYVEALHRFGNPSSSHRYGREARRYVNEARELIASLLHTSETKLLFTSGGTESINSVLVGSMIPRDPKQNHMIVSRVEHSAVLATAKYLASLGIEVSFLDVDSCGRLMLDQLPQLIRPETKLIAVMAANNEIGNLYPIEKIQQIAKQYEVTLFCDGVQWVGKMPVNLQSTPLDFLAASAHKFHGPKGIGFLAFQQKSSFEPLLHGGRQEWGQRAGTEHVAGIWAMAKALEMAHQDLAEVQSRVAQRRDLLEAQLKEKIPDLIIHGDLKNRLPNTSNIRIPGISGESLLMNLDLQGLAASVGSACESGSLEPSHVLMAMGLDSEDALGALRLSLSRVNNEAEVHQAVNIIVEVVQRLRAT